MFQAIILSIFRSTRLCVTTCGIINPRCCRPVAGIINTPLLLHPVGCLYYLHQLCTVKQISDNEIDLLIKYTKSFLWRVAKRLSFIKDARCLKVNAELRILRQMFPFDKIPVGKDLMNIYPLLIKPRERH